MRQTFSHSGDTILVRPARWGHSVSAQRNKSMQAERQSTTKVLGATVTIVAVMAPLSSAWMQPATSLSGQRALHDMQLSSFRQARIGIGNGGQFANDHAPISLLQLQRPWRHQQLAEFGCTGKVALAAKKKKKVDADILEKRAKAAAIREEAIRKAAETKRLKELGQSAEAATSKPIDSAKQTSTPDRAVATAEPVVASPTTVLTRTARRPTGARARNPAPTVNGRKHAASVAELRAIKAIDTKTPQVAKRERHEDASRDDAVRKRPTRAEVMKMKVIDLKDVLRAAKLKVGGRKAELLERVLEYIEVA